MNESTVHERLRDYVRRGEPPMGLTASGMVRAGRRSRRLRTLTATGGGVAVLTVAAAVTMVAGGPQAVNHSAAATVTPTMVLVECPIEPLAGWRQMKARCLLTYAVRSRLAPGAELVEDPVRPFIMGSHLNQPDGADVSLVGEGTVRVAEGDMTIYVWGANVDDPKPNEEPCRGTDQNDDFWQTCVERTGPRGEYVFVRRDFSQDVEVTRLAYVRHGNAWVTVRSMRTEGSSPELGFPLSADQMVEVALGLVPLVTEVG